MASPALISARPVIKVDGQANTALADALTAMVINLPAGGAADGELTLTNWGPAGSSGNLDFVFQDIAFGKSIEILMGPNQDRIFKGEITGLEERYGNGAPQLQILVQDVLHRMARDRRSRVFDSRSPDDIVNTIAGDAGLQSDVNLSSDSATFHQLNESNLAFLIRLAGYFGIAVRLQDDKLRVRPEEVDPQPLALNVQDSARSVRLTADLNHQHATTKVQGYNPSTAEAVQFSATALSPAPTGTTAYQTLGQLGWPDEEIVPQPFPISRAHAEAFARGHFARQAEHFLSGEVRCLGEPTMRPGREIDLAGVSPRMLGTYRVAHCVHRFDNASGYETHLKVTRGSWRV